MSRTNINPLFYLRWPKTLLALVAVTLAVAASFAPQFHFDASSDTLVVEGDPDLATYNRMVDTFGGDAFLFLTFEPQQGSPFTPEALQTLAELVDQLRNVEGVSSVFSVLDAPLLKSPPITLAQALTELPTLRSDNIDLQLAQAELSASPFFRELLVTSDGSATAIKINLAADEQWQQAEQDYETAIAQDPDDEDALTALRAARQAQQARGARLIEAVRKVRNDFSDHGTLYLGGVPMIAADMVAYVKSDLFTFGGTVLVLMVFALLLFFRKPRWVVLPLTTAALVIVFTVGLLGYLDWQATVISSNFMALLGITTVSLTIHLIVQYRELLLLDSSLSHTQLVLDTMRKKFIPCLYTALTTIAAFGSLTVSGILPVEYFGWMMCIGIIVAFATTYTFFPAALLLLKTSPASNLGQANHFIRGLGDFVRWRPGTVTILSVLIGIAAVVGISRISLDNRFIDYFDTDTEIYQGMHYIDQHLGGTIPFDVVLQFEPYVEEADAEDDFFFEETLESPQHYWFTRGKLDALEKMHRFLDNQPQVGKVLSLTALEDFALEFTDGRKLSNPEIVAVLGALPDDLFGQLIDPHAHPASGQMRLSGRIQESGPSFDREVFCQQILDFGATEVTFASDVQVTGMMVLFNGMLAQLFSSQVNTLAYILAIVFVMFLILLRNLRYALLGMIPNSLASATVIGAMGYFGIPLDMMTTTIAAVCIGIGVDDTIHYLHRFREEFQRWEDARIAVSFAHESIGRALLYTSLTVVAGFSVLTFSNFIPTVMFGLWTAVAMVLALIANLTLLPALLVLTHRKRRPTPTPRQTTDPSSGTL